MREGEREREGEGGGCRGIVLTRGPKLVRRDHGCTYASTTYLSGGGDVPQVEQPLPVCTQQHVVS